MSEQQPATLFLNQLETLLGKDPEFYKGVPARDGMKEPAILVFKDVPEKDSMTCVTYGLSMGRHEKWTQGRRPELILTVDTHDVEWAIELVNLVSTARGDFPFSYGQRIKLSRKMDNSNVSSFVIFAPVFLSREQFMDIDVGLDFKICLTGMYPITNGESEVIDMIGFENFWKDETFNLSTVRK